MQTAIGSFLKTLTLGQLGSLETNNEENSTVGKLARVYEIARNALEYRADHLVRRAAIERILRRKLLFSRNSTDLASELVEELKWAMYMTEVEEQKVKEMDIKIILDKYMEVLTNGKFSKDWLLGLISAEIEERFNPNVDYQRFTSFAFNYLRNKVELENPADTDLMLYVSIDLAYSQSDQQQVAYHLYKLTRTQALNDNRTEEEIFKAAESAFKKAIGSKTVNKLSAFVRRQMGPLVLLRDIYFANPSGFVNLVENKEKFIDFANETLKSQLQIMGGRIKTATLRSLLYVFLTKMLIAILIELPLERLLAGGVNYLTLGLNLIIPIVVMLGLTATAKLPNKQEQDRIVSHAWEVVNGFDNHALHVEKFTQKNRMSKFSSGIFGILYLGLFLLIFSMILRGLTWIGYNLLNLFVFVFFLSVVSFFAFRIRQTAQVYTIKGNKGRRTNFGDVVILPIVVLGGWLSVGVSRLNFLVFVFDFILEAPFKLILRFLDNWFSYISNRRDEVVG